MTAKTNITLVPACVAAEEYTRRNPNYEKTDTELYNAFMAGAAWQARAAVEADRADHFRGATKMVPSDEQAAFQSWAEIEYRNENTYSARDYRMGLDAWKQRGRYSSGQPETGKTVLVENQDVAGQPAASAEDDVPYPFLPQGWTIGFSEQCRTYRAEGRNGHGDWMPTRQAATAQAWAMAYAAVSAQRHAALVAQEPVANDIEDLIERVLDAQQDINLEANMRMSQTLCSASALLDDVETALRRYAAPIAAQAQPLLYQHDDGRYSLSFGPARFAVGNPAWHRVPIDVIDAAQPGAQDREDAERMDWLDNVAHCADWLEGEPTKRVIRASDGAEFTGDTWREAIDAARAAKGADHG